MSDRTCVRCHERPAADGIEWCRGCLHRIERDLGDLPALAEDLEQTMARVSGARLGRRRGGETALPYAERAADALHQMRSYLAGWCRLLDDELGRPLPADTIVGMAAHLQRWLGDLARHPAAAEFADELMDVYGRATVAIDLPRDRTRVTVGPCPETCDDGTRCPGEVVARFPRDDAERPSMRCGACGAEWWAEQWSGVGERILRRMGRVLPLDAEATRRLLRMVGA